jgi:hypothetical protein
VPKRFNSPPGWPVPPSDWTPQPGWTPDPSWPVPPPGWAFWVDETPAARPSLGTDARWIIGGGAAVFIGSLLPFVSYVPNPYVTLTFNGLRSSGVFFGPIIIGLGAAISYTPAAGWFASKAKTKVLAIVLLLLAGLMGLGYVGFAAAGTVGVQEPDGLGSTTTVNFSPNIGLVLAILGCAAAFVGAIISLAPADSALRRTRLTR